MTRAAIACALVLVGGCDVAIEFRSRADADSGAAIDASAMADASALPDGAAPDAGALDATIVPDAGEDRDAAADSADVESATPCTTDRDCPGGGRCAAGACAPCVVQAERCNGLDDDCDGLVDEDNPGAAVCAAGLTCRSGACVSTGGCAAGQTACGGACVNLSTDPSNCGACGSSCPAGQRCAMGVCSL